MKELGLKAAHCVITVDCRRGHGDHGALDEAVRRVRDAYQRSLDGWREQGKEPTFNLVLFVERPETEVKT